MKVKTIAFIMFIIIINSIYAQVVPFTRTYDLYSDQTGECLMSLEKTHDNGYIVAYNTNEWWDTRTSILKLNENGDVEWHHILDVNEFPDAWAYSICVDSEDNYYIAGEFCKIYYPALWLDYNGFVAKYNCDGEYIWGRSYGSFPQHETDSAFDDEGINDIISYDDNRLIIVGSESYCPENAFQFAGRPWVFAIDSSGNMLWEWNYCDDTVHMFGKFWGVTKIDDGKIFAAGQIVRPRVPGDYNQPADNLGFIAIFSENGDLLKRRTWNFLKNVSFFTDVKSLNNNNVAVVGYTADTLVYAGDKKERLSLIVFDSELNEKFQYNINVGYEGGYSKISVDNDTNIFLIGITYPSYLDENTEKRSDMLIAKYDINAELIWKKFVGEDNIWYQLPQLDVVADNDGGATFCSMLEDFVALTGGSYLYKVNELGEGDFSISNFPYPDDDEYIIYNDIVSVEKEDILIYPNPAKSELVIQIPERYIGCTMSLINLSGENVMTTKLLEIKSSINAEIFKNGVYILKLEKEGIYFYKKIVICK
jgi:hypothetical protein